MELAKLSGCVAHVATLPLHVKGQLFEGSP